MPSFPKDTFLPFALSKDFTHLLDRICEMQIYICDDVLEYVIVLSKKQQQTALNSNKRTKNH